MATGLEVAEVFRRHGETYRQVHAEHLGRTERRVMGAIAACRTAALGGHAEFCEDCGLVRCAYNSLPQPALPKVPGARAGRVARRPASRTGLCQTSLRPPRAGAVLPLAATPPPSPSPTAG